MLYQIQDGTVSLGGEVILSHFDFEIRGREKIALVGRNGTGKTTLLRLLAGELHLDRDDKRKQPGICTSRQITVGMLPQQVFHSEEEEERTVEEELLFYCPVRDTWDRERFLYEQEYDRLFTGFGFRKEDKKKKLSEFSGGQRTRIALIRLMLMKPDLLLLDEPTNHLDQDMLEWLEQWIRQYEKAVVMVSHDRFFLDETAEVVYEIENRDLKRYVGNYSAYVEMKQKNRRLQQREWERQQAEVERLNDLIKKFRGKPKKAAFARSRQKILDRMELIGKPDGEDVRPIFGTIRPELISAKYVFEAEDLQIGYDHALLKLGLRIRRGQKIGVIGPNGVGKSTFLKTVAEQIPPVKGKCVLGERVTLQYFDQQTASMTDDCTVIEHFRKLYPGLTDRDARNVLARWLFKGRDTAVKISELSGGEKSRLMFAEIFQSCPNFMVLDEPTNHMDIPAKETLEAAFRAYEGTLLFVSHDRYFISQVADALLVFEPDQVIYYPFGYRHYLHRKKKAEEAQELRNRNREENAESEEAYMGGELLGIGMSAEDAALIDGFRRVPEAEKGRLRSISTEEAYRDWKRRLMEEDLERLEERVVQLERRLWEAELRELCEEAFTEGQEIRLLLDEARKQWTETCIAWDEDPDIQNAYETELSYS